MRLHRLMVLFVCLSAAPVSSVSADDPDIKKVPNSVVSMPLTGTVKSIDKKNSTINILDYTDNSASVDMRQNIQVLRDGKVVTLKQLKEGDRVVVMTKQDTSKPFGVPASTAPLAK